MRSIPPFIRFLLLSIILSAAVSANTLEYNFEKGNEYYANGEFKQAIGEYEKILQADYQSAEVYYNLGNAYFRQGMLGHAIKNYIRARRLAPRDDDIIANLDFARQFAIDKIEVTEETIFFQYVNKFFDWFSLSEVTWLSGILLVLVIAGMFIGSLYRWVRIPTPLLVTIAACFIITAIFAGVKLDRDVLTRTGVVISEQTEVRNGPGEDYNNQFTAHAGLVFKIEREESEYYLVNFENRLKGWIARAAVDEI
ncbi:MAG: tetratricopeptide repeat protein [Candidatus Zixiibacteriota bacterium]